MTESPPPASPPPVPVLALPPRQLALLSQGFRLLFWGACALVGVAIESLVTGRLRMFVVVIGALGVLGTALSGWRLRQVTGLGPHWRRATICLSLTGILTAYLAVFGWFWLQVPANFYLLCHAMAWVVLLLCHLVAANYCAYVLGQMLGSRSLALQGALYGLGVVLLLLVPLLVLVSTLLQNAWTGVNALGQLQYWLSQQNLASSLLFLWLTPLSLTMSLVWTAQDLAWERLTAPPPDPNLDQPHP